MRHSAGRRFFLMIIAAAIIVPTLPSGQRPGAASAPSPGPAVVIRHARLVDGTDAPPLEDAAVIIVGPAVRLCGPG